MSGEPAEECKVCEGTGFVFIGQGAQTDFCVCPACVGVHRDELNATEIADVEAACKEAGVPVRWLS